MGEAVLYTLYIKDYSMLSSLHGTLCAVRREVLERGTRVKDRARETENGVEVFCQYSAGPGKFKWEKRSGKQLLERSYPLADGYGMDCWDMNGRLTSKAVFGRDFRWEKTTCFAENENHPVMILSAMREGGQISKLEYDRESKKYHRITLYPCKVEFGSAAQSLIDDAVGEPRIYASTSEGDFCYCGENEKKCREQMAAKIAAGELSTAPQWEANPQDLLFEKEEEDDVPVCEDFEQRVMESLDWNILHKAPEPRSYPVDREIHFDPVKPEIPEPQAPPTPAPEAVIPVTLPPPAAPVIQAVPAGPVVSGKPPVRYAVAAKGMNGALQMVDDLLRKTEQKQEESEPLPEILPAKSVVISAQESYQYFGNVLNGLRQGRGRTQMPSGATAYEGDYVNDKREGFGAYYYKNGQLCYAGDWKDNKRDGVGVAFRPQDGGMYVGVWKEDKPVGCGSVFDGQGNLRFAGRVVDGQRSGAGVTYHADSGTIFVGKWENNVPTGEGSAFDSNGNLRYTGGWKNGMRNGMGTEYSAEGTVLYVGLWENDQRRRGIIYENGFPREFNLNE